MKTDPPPINDPAQAPEQAGASPTAPFVCLNGEMLCAAKARISVLDHGLLYGDGLFETLRIVQGRCFQMEAHLQRLSEGAERLRISLPWPREELRRALQETVAANGLSTGAIRLTVTRGAGAPVPSPVVCAEPTFFITLRGGSAPPDVAGVVRLSVGPEHPRLFVPGIKSLCYLPFQVARLQAQAAGFDDALLQFAGNAVETTVSNLFLVSDGAVSTPRLDTGCLPGVTRALVLRLCADLGIAVREREVHMSELPQAAELFVTSSLQGIRSVAAVGQVCIGDGNTGPVTQALQRAYAGELARECGA